MKKKKKTFKQILKNNLEIIVMVICAIVMVFGALVSGKVNTIGKYTNVEQTSVVMPKKQRNNTLPTRPSKKILSNNKMDSNTYVIDTNLRIISQNNMANFYNNNANIYDNYYKLGWIYKSNLKTTSKFIYETIYASNCEFYLTSYSVGELEQYNRIKLETGSGVTAQRLYYYEIGNYNWNSDTYIIIFEIKFKSKATSDYQFKFGVFENYNYTDNTHLSEVWDKYNYDYDNTELNMWADQCYEQGYDYMEDIYERYESNHTYTDTQYAEHGQSEYNRGLQNGSDGAIKNQVKGYMEQFNTSSYYTFSGNESNVISSLQYTAQGLKLNVDSTKIINSSTYINGDYLENIKFINISLPYNQVNGTYTILYLQNKSFYFSPNSDKQTLNATIRTKGNNETSYTINVYFYRDTYNGQSYSYNSNNKTFTILIHYVDVATISNSVYNYIKTYIGEDTTFEIRGGGMVCKYANNITDYNFIWYSDFLKEDSSYYYNLGIETGYAQGQQSVDTQAYYENGYSVGYENGHSVGVNENYSLTNEIGGIINLPFTFAKDSLNFEILGLNLYQLVLGGFTLLLVLFLIKKAV